VLDDRAGERADNPHLESVEDPDCPKANEDHPMPPAPLQTVHASRGLGLDHACPVGVGLLPVTLPLVPVETGGVVTPGPGISSTVSGRALCTALSLPPLLTPQSSVLAIHKAQLRRRFDGRFRWE
jgi:hypothetical protein